MIIEKFRNFLCIRYNELNFYVKNMEMHKMFTVNRYKHGFEGLDPGEFRSSLREPYLNEYENFIFELQQQKPHKIKSKYLRLYTENWILKCLYDMPFYDFQTERLWVQFLIHHPDYTGKPQWRLFDSYCNCANPNVVKLFVRNHPNGGELFREIPMWLRTSSSAIEAVKKDPENLRYVPFHIQTEELIQIYVKLSMRKTNMNRYINPNLHKLYKSLCNLRKLLEKPIEIYQGDNP